MINNKISNTTKLDAKVWNKIDTTWTLGLFGTAIGAGVLFFPIKAGYGGLIPILIMLVLAYPIAFLCHRALSRYCLSSQRTTDDITKTVEQQFGKNGGVIMTFLYFFAICPILWIYGVSITNTFMEFWSHQLGYQPLNRGVVAFSILLLIAVIIMFGKDIMVRTMSYLVYPFVASLILCSIALIPYWNGAVFSSVSANSFVLWGNGGLLMTILGGIGIMVFSFSFSAVISSFIVSQRLLYEADNGLELTAAKSSQIISRASFMMVFVVMFFAFSCVFTLSQEQMQEAKALNIPILSYLARHFQTISGPESMLSSIFIWVAPIIALVAIFKSYIGHYLGSLEGMNGLLNAFVFKKRKMNAKMLNFISMLFIMTSTWTIAYFNPNVLDLIDMIGAPIIAGLLCLLPTFAFNRAKTPFLQKYKGLISNYFVAIVGILTILNIIVPLCIN